MDLKSLFAAHERELERFFSRKIRETSETEDLIQETFLRLARMSDKSNVREPRRFLFTVAANLARDHLRKALSRHSRTTGMLDTEFVDGAEAVDEGLGRRQEEELAEKAIQSLPEKTRAIFLLYHVEGWSYRQIADELKISPRTVEYHLRQGLAFCREFINHNS